MFSSLSICVVSFWKSSKKLVRCRGPFVIDHYRCVNLPPHWLRLCWCSHWEHQQARRSGVHRFNTDSHLFTDADNTRTTNTPRSKHWQAREMANNKVCEELITNMTTRENIVSGWGGSTFISSIAWALLKILSCIVLIVSLIWYCFLWSTIDSLKQPPILGYLRAFLKKIMGWNKV